MLTRAIALGCFIAVAAGCATDNPSAPVTIESADQRIRVLNYDRALNRGQLERLAAQAAREYAALGALLGTDVGPITVRVRNSGIGRHFPPAAIRIPSRLIRKSTAITAHEITHLLSQGWANRVLKEGLATYLQNRLGEQNGWPNYRRSVHGAARHWGRKRDVGVRDLAAAEAVLSKGLRATSQARQAAYSLSGSWVQWLIEEKLDGNITRFMGEIYRTENYRQVFGFPLRHLQAKWQTEVMGR